MRYVLFREGVKIAQADDVMDLVNGVWPAIRDDWKAGFVVHDNRPGVKWATWSAVWRAEVNGVELSPIG